MQSRSKHRAVVGVLLLAVSVALGQDQATPIAGEAVDAQILPAGAVRGTPLTAHCVGSMSWDEMLQLQALRAQLPRAEPKAFPRMMPPIQGEVGPGGPAPAPAPAPVVERKAADRSEGLPAPLLVASFEALRDNHGSIPPDTMGAVGPFHVVTHTNQRVRVQLREGSEFSTVDLGTFWAPASPDSAFDPVVMYDAMAGRFIACVDSHRKSAGSRILFAISRTADPTDVWDFYSFDADPADVAWADFPRMGYNSKWIAFTQNMFAIPPATGFHGVSMWVLDKATTVPPGGLITVWRFDYGFDTAGGASYLGGTLVPAETHDADEGTLWIVDCSSSTVLGGIPIHRLSRITGTTSPVWSVAPGGRYPGSGEYHASWYYGIGDNVEAEQFGTSTRIDAGDWRCLDAEFRNGSLWYTHAAMIPYDVPNRTSTFWYEVDPQADLTNPIVQSYFVDAPGWYHTYPSLAVNCAGDMMLGFSRFSASIYAQAAFTYRLAGDTPGTTRPVQTLKAGVDTYTRTVGGGNVRWGDYSATCVDPLDDRMMWTIQEWADDGGIFYPSNVWNTWWGQLGEVVHVWVSFAYPFNGNGSFYFPFDNLASGVAAAPSGGVIGLVGPASTSQTLTINKHVVIKAFNGPSTIGQ